MSDPATIPPGSATPATLGDQPLTGQALRHFWMYAGSIILMMTAAVISKQAAWTYSWVDVCYFATVLAMAGARALDVLRFGGLTTDEKPATPRHLVRYTLSLAVVTALLWVAAQAVHTG